MSDDFWRDDPEDDGVANADADLIEDPEALRRAEQAVASMGEQAASWVPTDAEWLPVAAAPSGIGWSLEELRGVLEAEGIPAGYDPYDPREAITLPYGLSTEFRVIVPVERLSDALRVVAELAAEGAAWTPVPQEPRP
jgi:hypothetical protein